MIKRIVVIGSGVMGRGIAYVGAVGGYAVTIVDINESALKNAQQEVDVLLEKGLSRGKISANLADKARSNLSYENDLANAAGTADLIIEAVPEITTIKNKSSKRLRNTHQLIVILQRIHRQ